MAHIEQSSVHGNLYPFFSTHAGEMAAALKTLEFYDKQNVPEYLQAQGPLPNARNLLLKNLVAARGFEFLNLHIQALIIFRNPRVTKFHRVPYRIK